MKLYFDSDADGIPDTEVTGIIHYPTITTILDKPSTCVISITDSEAALYTTWEPRDFTKMSIKDDAGNQIFIGYLVQKKFEHNSLELTIAGFGIRMSWKHFNKNCTLEQGRLRAIADGELITCYDDVDLDGDYLGAAEDYGWAVDQWADNLQNKGIIVETPAGLDTELWKCSALDDSAYFTTEAGNAASTADYQDESEYIGVKDDTVAGEAVVFTVDSTWDAGEDVIADTKYLKEIKIDYRYSMTAEPSGNNIQGVNLEIYNYTTTSYENVGQISQGSQDLEYHKTTDSVGGTKHLAAPLNPKVFEQSATITLSDYLDDDGAGNYDEMKFRLRVISTSTVPGVKIWVDYIAVRIYYHSDDVGAIMLPIHENGVSTITSYGADWDNLGVAEDDGFKIGEDTKTIIREICNKAGLNEYIVDDFGNTATYPTIYPTGDTATIEWTTTDGGGVHYTEINDASDLTYVDTAINAEEDIYTFDTPNLLGGYVSGIKIYHRQKCDVIDKEVLGISYSTDGGSTWSSVKSDDLTAAWVTENSAWTGLTIYDMSDFQVKLLYTQIFAGSAAYVSKLYCDFTIKQSDFDKYDARDFKGSFCVDALRKICTLEGAHWCEDHELEIINVLKPASFPDTAVDLTSADYGYDWKFEDKCNSVSSVQVYGNATLRVVATSTAGDADSPIERQIIDEGIAAYANALKLAESEVGLYATKKPNIKLSLDGVNTALKVGTKVHITFERPTIAIAFYPIRIIERAKFGGGIRTTIHCGLGMTEADEKIANAIINASFLAHDAHQARLIATPAGTGATITWGDVGGAQAAVEAIITTEVGAGESIDNAIDTLIATHKAVMDAQILVNENVGEANSAYQHLILESENKNSHTMECSTAYRNWDANDTYLHFGIPLPNIKKVNGTTYYLTIDRIRFYLLDADAGDCVNVTYLYSRQNDGTSTDHCADGTDYSAIQEHDIDFADAVFETEPERPTVMFALTLTNSREFEMLYAQVRYWYDPAV